MKNTLSYLLLCILFLLGCHKNDVDIDELNTNPFDPDHPELADFLDIGQITTASYAQGLHYKQTVEVHVHPERFPVHEEYALRFIELSDPDTLVFYSLNSDDDYFECPNYLVTLGTEYCYRFELLVGGEVVQREERCQVAEL